MRLLFLICLAFNLFAFELFINSGKEANKNISVLHIRNNTDIICDKLQDENLKIYYKCVANGKSRLISNQDLPLFKINFHNKKSKLEMYIYPKTNVSLVNSEQKLYKDNTVQIGNRKKSKSLTFIFYSYPQGSLSPNGLDFDVIFPDLKTPFIEGLDLDQNPVNISDNSDINTYLGIKKYYENKQFKELLDLCNIAIEKYQNSVFVSEFYLYKIRAMFNMLNTNTGFSEDIILNSKEYIRAFPSDENYAEILQMMSKTYLKLEQRGDAEYLIDILNNEHPNSYFTKLASLNYADYLIAHNKRDAAAIIYNNILFTSSDAALASRAAIALAKINISHNKIKEAKEFVLKVFNANQEYLLEDKEKTIALADDFYKEKMYDICAPIFEFVLKNSNSADQYYEKLLKKLGISLAKNNEFEKADKYLNQYKDLYPNGEFISLIDETIDNLYFEKDESDSFKLHEYYNFLMAKYNNNIAKKALKEETKLLYKENEFEKILKLKEKILESEDKNLKELFEKSLLNLVNNALKADNCEKIIDYIKNHNFDNFEKIIHKNIFLQCLIRKGQNTLAYDFAKMFEKEDFIHYRLEQAKLLYTFGDYDEVIKTLNSILNKRGEIKKDEYFDIYYYLSLSLLKLNKYNDAIFALKKLEKYNNNFKLAEVYNEFFDYFLQNNLTLSIITYGKKAIDLQNKKGINIYSPKIEFETIKALTSKKRIDEIKEILVDLYKLKLTNDEFSYAKYLEATALIENKEFLKAKKALNECKEGEWKKLCDEKLEILN